MEHTGAFSIVAINDYIPQKLKPWVMILIVIIIQLSGGVYLASISQMTGALSLMQEDILMAGYASLLGMSLTFTIMFRLKFRFTSKFSLLICCFVIIVSNLICMHSSNVFILVLTCFIAGFFRMWATFECNSSIQLWLTPKRDLSIFFCYIYLLVQSCIQLCGLLSIYSSFFYNWKYMHLIIITLLLIIMITIMFIFNDKRSLPKMPLLGIDWFGMFLWGAGILSILYVLVYGNHLDWWQSKQIRIALIAGASIIALNILRASFIRHPFIPLITFKYKIVYTTVFLFFIVDILLAPSHILEHIYLEKILGYDSINYINLNYIILIGVFVGGIFSYYTFAIKKWGYKTMTVIAFSCIIIYLLIFYFIVDYNLSKSSLFLPLFLRSFAYVIISICFLTSLSRVPFEHFFNAVSVQGFASAAIGGIFGASVIEHFFKVLFNKNFNNISSSLDNVNTTINRFITSELTQKINEQVLLVSIKEIYGYLCIGAILCLLIFLLKESDIRPKNVIHPTYNAIARAIRKSF